MADEESDSRSLYRPSVPVVCPRVCGHGRIAPPATVTEKGRGGDVRQGMLMSLNEI